MTISIDTVTGLINTIQNANAKVTLVNLVKGIFEIQGAMKSKGPIVEICKAASR